MDVSGLSAVAPNGQDTAWKAKLADGAKQFEAMMLEQMMKPLMFGGAPGAPGPDDADNAESGDAAADVIRSFGTEAMARAVANGGGFGLAKQILREVSAERDAQAARHS